MFAFQCKMISFLFCNILRSKFFEINVFILKKILVLSFVRAKNSTTNLWKYLLDGVPRKENKHRRAGESGLPAVTRGPGAFPAGSVR